MKPTIFVRISKEKPCWEDIRKASEIIRKGGLVAFPTETVYGLGADALNPKAVTRIFQAKKRPFDNPIITHIADKNMLKKLTVSIPDRAERLINAFWPGPLTLILKASNIVPKITRGGLPTIAVRMPDSQIALALIKETGAPIAAPSANISGKPSPTTAEHVRFDLDGRIEMILDGGPVDLGIESTVLDLTSDPPLILRPGGVTYESLSRIIERIEIHSSVLSHKNKGVTRALSPGMRHKHYSPNAQIILIEGEKESIIKKIQELASLYLGMGKKVGVLVSEETRKSYLANSIKVFGSRNNPVTIAKNLFGLLREFDEENIEVILAEGIAIDGLGMAIMNRLRRASGYNIIETI